MEILLWVVFGRFAKFAQFWGLAVRDLKILILTAQGTSLRESTSFKPFCTNIRKDGWGNIKKPRNEMSPLIQCCTTVRAVIKARQCEFLPGSTQWEKFSAFVRAFNERTEFFSGCIIIIIIIKRQIYPAVIKDMCYTTRQAEMIILSYMVSNNM